MPFAELLRELRQKAGLTQQELADRADMPVSSLRGHEQGQRSPSWSAVVKLAKALGVTADTFSVCDEVNAPDKPAPKKPKGKKS